MISFVAPISVKAKIIYAPNKTPSASYANILIVGNIGDTAFKRTNAASMYY